ncbi:MULTISPECIES: PAS domain-containing sensor histidine kinase [unclassified Rhizobium]|uniref:sensor histidine kinase NtrY-like n=1 Tax=unclassified Rhizobium TaxID=2613769 RepID=UPI001611EDD2|nr:MULTISPECIES: PAS domain-containing sensor histidine kinase [unclassified Rhizobium]MBB3288857.1 two-component system nitrogen regulation sensor histidine kinase NtrY [Rhizobium sp. BK252]MBB3403599.1 two-component system nitrogen regulation sensor histidine kinase NtrY [Rhizobium sp. BK289]MBB3416216.1 two-component system nitrogen regulation sensor histidine kinase NtrY [Rhizobium sp. BK284]MBB3484062.1 two-component system nitrogen regulation sensor histidine kinase NtrY [Rhizobium sp. BK
MMQDAVSPAASDEAVVKVMDRRASFALPGLILAGGALLCAIATLLMLLGLTPIAPTPSVVFTSVVINGLFVLGLIALIAREVARLMKARSRGRAAARLHIRIVVLFSIVAITPAILVAIVASLTLNVGLDRWFGVRTQQIISSSQNVAQAYLMENASYLQGQTVSMANDLERNRSLFNLDRTGFADLMTRQARGRGLLGAFLVRRDGSAIVQAEIKTERPLPAIPKDALDSSANGQPTLIPPGVTNLVGAVIKLDEIPGSFLYTVRAVDPRVMNAMRMVEDNTVEYKAMEAGRMSLQIAFAVLYIGFALIVLLAAIWTAIAIADRIVRPIRLLISAADNVASGNMNVLVPVRSADGDVGSLSRTFNKMISEIRTQRDEILEAKDEVDDRRRFIEAVLSGVTAAVIGVEHDRRITIVNTSAEDLLTLKSDELIGKNLSEIAPEVDQVVTEATTRHRSDFRKQISLVRGGTVRTLSVQVTREESRDANESYVITLDDITDLVIAQRSTAWADVARRIAHEIKNPLTPIQLSAERIRRRFGKNIADADRPIFDQCTDTIIRQVGDIGRMVDEFSSFARMPKPTMEPTDLRDILRDAVFLREMGNTHVQFERELGDERLEGMFDARMLGQAFGNLIKNAVEAIEGVPSDQAREQPKVLVRSSLDPERDRFTVDVIDNGRGLPVENRHSILEPYMTMREKGTGLGLAIVKKIIEDHGGQIELHDAPADFDQGRGAMIRVHLPRREQATVAHTASDKESVYGI